VWRSIAEWRSSPPTDDAAVVTTASWLAGGCELESLATQSRQRSDTKEIAVGPSPMAAPAPPRAPRSAEPSVRAAARSTESAENRKNDTLYRDAHASCLRSRGYRG
jgi:hypothetical protein